MKKALIFLLLPLPLASCGSNEAELTIATPSGAPSLAFYSLVNNPNLEINANPDNLSSYLDNGNKDIVVMPTNDGIQAIRNGAPYKIAANLTFGNFFLASTGNDGDGILNEGDYVVLFQQGKLPDKIFSSLYGEENLDLHYVKAGSDAAKCLITGKDESNDNHNVDYVLVPEPALTNALSNNERASEYASLQEVFKEKHDGKEITQASLFVYNKASKSKVKELLKAVSENVENYLQDPSILENYLSDLDNLDCQAKFGAPLPMLKALTTRGNRIGIGYKDAKENKESIDSFISLFEMEKTSEEIYFAQ